MNTTTLTNTLSLADLINKSGKPMTEAGLQVAAINRGADMLDEVSGRTFNDMNGIAVAESGLVYIFPSVFKMRETVEWETSVAESRVELRKCNLAQMEPTDGFAARVVTSVTEHNIRRLLDLRTSFDKKMSGHLPYVLCNIWATADALCLEINGKLWEQGDKPLGFLQDIVFDVYGIGGRALASQVWDFVEMTHVTNITDFIVARKAKKAVAKAAKKARKR